MDRLSSVVAALEAGKLPATQQLTRFLDFLSSVITQVEPTSLTSQGRLLAEDVKGVLTAYKALLVNKNGDNCLQEALWHLAQGDVSATTAQSIDPDSALDDINALRSAVRDLLKVVWSSTTQEGAALSYDFLSFVRLALAGAAEMVEGQAARAKRTLRQVEQDVQQGHRDPLGRDKQRLEERNQSIKAQFEQGMDTIKVAGAAVIGAGEQATASAHHTADKAASQLEEAFFKICDKAQSNPSYQRAIKTIFTILSSRLSQSRRTIQDAGSLTLPALINDPTPEQHIPKAVDAILEVLERIAPLSSLVSSFQKCLLSVIQDESLSAFIKQVSDHMLHSLTKPGYARSDEARSDREVLRSKWDGILHKDTKWQSEVDALRHELQTFAQAVQNDEDLTQLRDAHVKLARDLESGLPNLALEKAEAGLHAAMQRAVWFYQDLLKVYLPRLLSMLKDVPIPRTEYVDPDIEFVLENLDISSCNLLPSHVYIRNITDVDFRAAPDSQSRTAFGTLTHIRIQAIQLQLNDLSFYYKDKKAPALAPSEYTGLIAATLPPEGVTIELKVRLIPTTNMKQREDAHRYTVLEHVSVNVSQDIDVEVKNSNHSLYLSVFKPLMVSRLRDVLEKTLTEQIRWVVGWIDGIAWDINRRREVFEDAGAGMWSSIGRRHHERSWKDAPL